MSDLSDGEYYAGSKDVLCGVYVGAMRHSGSQSIATSV